MSSVSVLRQPPVLWSRVDQDFYICTVDTEVLGYVERHGLAYAGFDERSRPVGSSASLTDAMAAVVGERAPGRATVPQRAEGQLYALVYTSLAATAFLDSHLDELLESSRDANRKNSVTGILLYRSGRFVQYLEGSRSSLTALMASIAADPRHSSVEVLVEGPAAARQFEDWTMGYERLAEPSDPLPEGFRSSFDDLDSESGDEAMRALSELSFWFRVRNTA
ncbi:BLUF domain-containing protein [Salinibacterium soli]|uniref:BLUF domain-containing protein n=1 Tax=Antiquaquibacter soli TaxID=3064523 RepID=A0ABT9BQ84_9MICO|nr:BLUF domain-containing protein [Protaetiibacter sp. WY-16]MDO7883188.1 BLUF domain-containing protein [Protaetiibacter sp. WY-16]